jgi:hypothetical protein
MITPRGLKKANELRSTDKNSSFKSDDRLIAEEFKTETKTMTPTAGVGDENLLIKKSKTINFNAVTPINQDKRDSNSSRFEVKSVESN